MKKQASVDRMMEACFWKEIWKMMEENGKCSEKYIKDSKSYLDPFCLWAIGLVSIWNYCELKFKHCSIACSFLQNMGILEIVRTWHRYGSICGLRYFLHSLYHNISASSLHNALSFCSLFALVIAMIQTIYPYRLGKNKGYPINKLDYEPEHEPVRTEEVKGLILCAGMIIVMEFFQLYLVEVSIALVGCGIIARWLLRLVGWYKRQENSSTLFLKQAKKDLEIIFKASVIGNDSMEERAQAKEDLKRILILNIQEAGVEEWEFLENFAKLLSTPDKYLDKISEKREIVTENRKTIFEYSFYFSNNATNIGLASIGYSWYYRMLKNVLAHAQYNTPYGEVFIKGILLGCMGTCDEQMIRGCVDEMIPSIEKKIQKEQFAELIGCLCVFLELYGNVNENILYGADYLLKSGCFEMIEEMTSEETEKKMQECYDYLVQLEILERIDEYDVVISLQQELNKTGQILNKIPQTILGGLSI